jgi:HTH-type transcriptional regulator/antitoxin HigA
MTNTILAEAFPAGEILADELEERGWTQADFAQILGRPVQFVSEIVNGKKEITRDSASQIAAALGTSPAFWLNLQDAYHLWRQAQNAAAQADLDDVRLRAKLRERFPISVLSQRGFIDKADPRKQQEQLCDLYGIEDIESKFELALAARKSDVMAPLSPLQEAWFACVRRAAADLDIPTYDKDAFADLAERLPRMLTAPLAFKNLPSLFAAVGVRLIYIEAFPSSKLDGGAFSLAGQPVIGLSGRGKRMDIVLFTLLHEMAHVSLGHADDHPIVDDDDGAEGSSTMILEVAANELAGRWIFPQGLPPLPSRISSAWIQDFSKQQGVNPIVVIGRLQSMRKIPWRSALVKNAPSVGDILGTWN